MKLARLLVALVVLGAPALARAQGTTPVPGACVGVQAPAVVGRFGGADVQAATGGRGIYLEFAQFSIDQAVRAQIGTSAILDANLVMVAPLFMFGRGAVASAVRHGTAAAPLAEGSNFFVSPGYYVQDDFREPVFVPPGSFITFVGINANQAFTVDVCFREVLP